MKKFYIIFLLVFIQFGYAQLSNFNLQVTATNETCSGNGTLSFAVTNTTAGASFVYNVFLLPNTTNPVGTTSNTTLTGLVAGNYQVVATQSLGSETNSQQQNITILNQIQNLTFTILDQKVKCGNDGVLIANVTSGNPVSYELLTGPVTMPVQSSNVFSNLPVGNYTIRVFDICGNAVVNSFTLTQNYTPLIIFTTYATDITCTTVNLEAVTNFTNSNIAFPLNVEFTVYPPNSGTPLIYTQTLTTFNLQGIEQIVPRYDGNYYYDLKIVDACGNTTSLNNNLINKNFSFAVFNLNGCTPKINISTVHAVFPYTVEFLSAPAGFNAAALNPSFPGPYFTPDIDLNVIEGNYTIKLTDACGKTHTANFHATVLETPIITSVSPFGCGGVSFSIDPVHEVTMVSVILISAPAAYTGTLPEDFSANIISPGYSWVHSGFPPGSYVFNVVDSCGVLHVISFTIGPAQAVSMNVVSYPDCTLETSSAYVYYNNVTIGSLIVLNAPAGFPFPLPYTITDNSTTSFVLNSVPVGDYTVEMTSSCGTTQTNLFSVDGYIDADTTIEIQQFCSSFNMKFVHQGNGAQAVFGLQKLNESTGNWEHPITGMQILSNAIDASNFYVINHNVWNLNLNFLGKFRIIKAYRELDLDLCIRPIKEFEVSGQPKILNTNVLNCGSGLTIVELNATGIGQLIYRITQKDSLPFVINNGNNNVFSNLVPAIYNFQIEDSCGNILNQQIQINSGIPILISSSLCENQLSSLTIDNYPFLQYEWWKDGNPTNILSTSSALTFNPFVSSTHSGLYHVRITHVGNPTSCLNSIKDYTISPQSIPMAGLDSTTNLCGVQNAVDLNSYLSGTFENNGSWSEITTSNGLLTNGVWDATSVNYGVYQFKYEVHGLCSISDEAIITLRIIEKPILNALPTSFLLCRGEDLLVNPGLNNPNYTYQWTGPNSFTSTNSSVEFNDMQSLSNGQYTLVVGNNGCFSDPYNFVIDVTSLPEFYINETCENNVKTLTAIPLEGTFDSTINFDWNGPNGFSGSTNPISISSGNIGDYLLTIERNACELSVSKTVTSTACEIPKGISPNGDGSNDFFDLTGFDVNEIKIYNRYGKIVYSKDGGYINEWYGQANNGNILSDSTYFYVLYLNSGASKTGWVYLMK